MTSGMNNYSDDFPVKADVPFKANSTMENVLMKHIGEQIDIHYNYTGENDDEYDFGILIEVGNGYIILDISERRFTIINLANVASIYLDKK